MVCNNAATKGKVLTAVVVDLLGRSLQICYRYGAGPAEGVMLAEHITVKEMNLADLSLSHQIQKVGSGTSQANNTKASDLLQLLIDAADLSSTGGCVDVVKNAIWSLSYDWVEVPLRSC